MDHLMVEFNSRFGKKFSYTYMVEPILLSRAEEWAAIAKDVSPEALIGWLGRQNAKLDSADGPAAVERSPDGSNSQKWFSKGVLHRMNGPAIIEANKTRRYEHWLDQGVLHRENGPAVIERGTDGYQADKWSIRGNLHREDGPAVTVQFGRYSCKKWYRDGALHRLGGPAHIEVREDGSEVEGWYVNGKAHRLDGPALIKTEADRGQTFEWHCKGQRHRIDGPAVIEVHADGKREEQWYFHGERDSFTRLRAIPGVKLSAPSPA